jgi:hypothetical protein
VRDDTAVLSVDGGVVYDWKSKKTSSLSKRPLRFATVPGPGKAIPPSRLPSSV